MSAFDLTSGSVARHLRRLTVPMFLGISSMIVASMIDTIYIGWIGTLELAAVSFTFPLVMAVSSVSMGLAMGATSIMSRILGGGDRARCLLIGTHTLILVFLLVVVISILGYVYAPVLFQWQGAGDEILPITVSYVRIWFVGLPLFAIPMVGGMMLRALGDARTPGIIMTLSAILQVLIAPPLIFGVAGKDGLGVNGSAWAFILSRAALSLYALFIFHRFGLFGHPGSVKQLFGSWAEVLRIGVPSMASNLIGPVSMSVLMALLAVHGHAVVAAFGIATRIESLAIMVLMALSSSIGPFVGQNYGARKTERIRKALSLSYWFSMVWGLFACAVLATFGDSIVGAMVDDVDVIEAAVYFMLIVPITFGFFGVTMMATSYFVALGQPMPSFVISMLRMVVVQIPLAVVFDFFFGYRGVFVAIAASNVMVGLLGYLWARRELSRDVRAGYPLGISA